MPDKQTTQREDSPTRIGTDSVFYNRVVPILLVGMGVLMSVLIVLALAVLLGFIPYN
ncbi:MAG: hypothetical protein PVF85_04055 [Anaerolineales bacterium]